WVTPARPIGLKELLIRLVIALPRSPALIASPPVVGGCTGAARACSVCGVFVIAWDSVDCAFDAAAVPAAWAVAACWAPCADGSATSRGGLNGVTLVAAADAAA